MAMTRLIVLLQSSKEWDLLGEETAMHEQYVGIKEALLATDGTGPKYFELTGQCFVAERFPETLFVRLEEVHGVSIQDL